MGVEVRGEFGPVVEQARHDLLGRGLSAGIARRLAVRLADARTAARDRVVRPFPWLGAPAIDQHPVSLGDGHADASGWITAAVVAALGVEPIWDELVHQDDPAPQPAHEQAAAARDGDDTQLTEVDGGRWR